jgi:hypothetical protein
MNGTSNSGELIHDQVEGQVKPTDAHIPTASERVNAINANILELFGKDSTDKLMAQPDNLYWLSPKQAREETLGKDQADLYDSLYEGYLNPMTPQAIFLIEAILELTKEIGLEPIANSPEKVIKIMTEQGIKPRSHDAGEINKLLALYSKIAKQSQ